MSVAGSGIYGGSMKQSGSIGVNRGYLSGHRGPWGGAIPPFPTQSRPLNTKGGKL